MSDDGGDATFNEVFSLEIADYESKKAKLLGGIIHPALPGFAGWTDTKIGVKSIDRIAKMQIAHNTLVTNALREIYDLL